MCLLHSWMHRCRNSLPGNFNDSISSYFSVPNQNIADCRLGSSISHSLLNGPNSGGGE
jgi:hypothetical protein